MDMKIKPMTPEERAFSYTQNKDILQHSGCIGYLRVDMDSDGFGFYSSWNDHNTKLKTQSFKDEFDDVINALRFDDQYDGLLKNRRTLAKNCYSQPDSSFGNGREYGFRVDTEDHSYMLRLNPNRGEYAAYIYAYDREMLDAELLSMPELMTVLAVEPGKMPCVKEIQPGLESLQREVGGNIEAIYPYEEPVALILNDEGNLNGLPLNRALRNENGDIYHVISGNFLVVGLGRDTFTSLSDEHIRQFKEKFKTPEMFIRMNGRPVVLPVPDAMEKKPSVLSKLKDYESAAKADSKKEPIRSRGKEER